MSRGSQLARRTYFFDRVGGGPGALQDAYAAGARAAQQVDGGGDDLRMSVVGVAERREAEPDRRGRR